MNEDQKQSVAGATKTQTLGSLEQTKAPSKAEQQKVVNSESGVKTAPVKAPEPPVKQQTVQPTAMVKTPDPVKLQPTSNTVSTAPTKAPEPVKPQAVQPTVQASEPVKSQPTLSTAPTPVKTTEPTTPVKTPESVVSVTVPEPVASQPTQPTEVPKLSDVVPTSMVWISGLIGDRQIDCLGPIEIPIKIDKPTYPFTPVPSNPNYTNQVFDYDNSTWLPTDAKSQGQQLTDLNKAVADLQQSIIKNDKDADQSQKVSIQQMQMLTSINAKLDVLTKKDGVK